MPLLQRKCACGGGCPRCQDELGIQTKLKIGKPGDKYEQEADRIADEVMRMPEPQLQQLGEPVEGEKEEEAIQTKPIADEITPLVQRQVELEEEEKVLQTKRASNASSTVTPELQSQIESVRTFGGQPLPPNVRAFMEPRFGQDFSNIRIHTGGKSDQLTRSLNAKAFTIGSDIVLRSGEFNPESSLGNRLLAHELTHTIQQDTFQNVRYSRNLMLQRSPCPTECLECPADGKVKEGCECFGLKKPKEVIPFIKQIKIVQLEYSKSISDINRQVAAANKTWGKAGIKLEAEIKSINRDDTEKILGYDDRKLLRKTVIIEPSDMALNYSSTRNILGIDDFGAEVSVPAGKSRHSVVVYYVPDFNRCSDEDEAVGCAMEGTLGNRFSIWINKKAQSVMLAHELGHMWLSLHDHHLPKDKKNVMHPQPTKTGLNADQIKDARSVLGLGSMRCIPKGASESDIEKNKREQQKSERNEKLEQALRTLASKDTQASTWKGPVMVNGTPKDSEMEITVEKWSSSVSVRYFWHDSDGEKVMGTITNARIEEGALKFDWKEKSVSGKAHLELDGDKKLKGTWGITTESKGGTWELNNKP
jgi:hypothetical protein